MSFPRYPEYKDSGVEWLGQVPKHWGVRPVWTFFRRKKQVDCPDEQLLSVYRDLGVVPKASRDDNFNKPSEDLSTYQLVEPGDLVINKMKAWQGSVAISQHRGIVSPAYFTYRALHRENAKFLHYLMRSVRYIHAYLLLSKGIRINQWDLEPELHSRMPVLVPPADEQHAIAQFLDRETAKIDALVAEQQRLIELLQEKRQAVISHAVTKGLNPAAPMKDSGIEWLGQIPAHWEIWRLKDISPRISGRLVYQPAQYFVAEGVPFLMGNNVTEDGVRWGDVKYVPPEINAQFAHHALREGDVITVRVGAPGVTCVVPKEADGLNCGSLMIIRQAPTFDPHWLAFVMNSPLVRVQIDRVQYGAAQEQINIRDAVNFVIPTPPLAEQQLLAAELRGINARSAGLVTHAERAIALLQERRTALISAAVTGQIDVRSARSAAA